MIRPLFTLIWLTAVAPPYLGAAVPDVLRVGIAGHAFDHLGNIGDQAQAAAASGANIIYVTGVGALGYGGLPPSDQLQAQKQTTAGYLDRARVAGIRLAIGYVCATSMVKLDAFDRNWSAEFRSRFHSNPADWRQQDLHGKPLASWYGGDYEAACMNHPDWRTYERFIVRQQLEAGCDGVFFDNPTVHPNGCYCHYCLKKFANFLEQKVHTTPASRPSRLTDLPALRDLPMHNPIPWLEFRSTVARDFLADMRAYARQVKPGALLTANNSLNAADVLFSQCRTYGYNIYEMSQAEDWVTVEDMSSQPRTLANGKTIEYGPTYKQLHAISHGKPVVAVTLAEADYHTPPNLVRLAMAEAVANDASYLSWPTWPEAERAKMLSLVRPEADFLRRHADLFRNSRPRRDVILWLPFRQWLTSDKCRASALAAELSRANIQFEVICEDAWQSSSTASFPGKVTAHSDGALPAALRDAKVLLTSARSDFDSSQDAMLKRFAHSGGALVIADHPNWLQDLQKAITEPSLRIESAPRVRVAVRDQPKRTIVHVLNLDIERISSFEDRLVPARDIHLAIRAPFRRVHSVRGLTADPSGTADSLPFTTKATGDQSLVEATLPRLEISTILIIE